MAGAAIQDYNLLNEVQSCAKENTNPAAMLELPLRFS